MNDKVNEFRELAWKADGFVFGSPVHYAALSGNMEAFMDRLFFSEFQGNQNHAFRLKPVAGVAVARRKGHKVEKVFLRSKKIGYCLACYHCKNHGGVCAIKDDMAELLDTMNSADVVVMASPVYFYSIDAR